MIIMPAETDVPRQSPKARRATGLMPGAHQLASGPPRRRKLIARAAMRPSSSDGITIQQFNEPAGGQVVAFCIVHVIPVFARAPGVRIRARWRIRRKAGTACLTLRARAFRAEF